MTQHINHLAIHRKRSNLTQSDIAKLIGWIEHSHICRSEKGERPPSLDMILGYHIIFDVSVEELFHGYKMSLLNNIKERIPNLLDELHILEASPRNHKRINYLSKLLERLEALSNKLTDRLSCIKNINHQ